MELYKEELITLSRLLGYVDDVSNQEGVFEVEIRVRFDDTDSWAVLGFGDAGEPCVLRIEPKVQPVSWLPNHPPGVRTLPAQGGFISTKPDDTYRTTINKEPYE